MRFLKYFLLLIIISSCKPTKDITRSTNLDTERLNAKQVIRKVSKSKSKFRSFQSKLKIKLNNKGKSKSYSANIRIIKDKAIWLSSTAGIVRVLITKDSLFYYNKLQKNYLKSSFSNIDEILGLKLSYETIESLLISEPVEKINKSDFNDSFNSKGDPYVFNWSIISNSPQINKNVFEGSYFINSNNFKINQYSFKIKQGRNNFNLYELSYFDFTDVDNMTFPSKIKLYKTNFEVQDREQENSATLNLDNYEGVLMDQINLEFKSIKLNNKFNLPFKIPADYKKILINVQ
ncbi:DUF4292 domain-containing protein [Flavobacteriaceae bacterium]|nr:DUF4292 domain-containing protein [Flavobacteriaceae bacterium]